MPTIVTREALLFRNPKNSSTITVRPSVRPTLVPDWATKDRTFAAHVEAGNIKDLSEPTPVPAPPVPPVIEPPVVEPTVVEPTTPETPQTPEDPTPAPTTAELEQVKQDIEKIIESSADSKAAKPAKGK